MVYEEPDSVNGKDDSREGEISLVAVSLLKSYLVGDCAMRNQSEVKDGEYGGK